MIKKLMKFNKKQKNVNYKIIVKIPKYVLNLEITTNIQMLLKKDYKKIQNR